MLKKDFERELWLACEGYFGLADWRDKRGRDFGWVLDELALNCSDEQWLIVDETLHMIADPSYIVEEVPCDTPVSENEWGMEKHDYSNGQTTGETQRA